MGVRCMSTGEIFGKVKDVFETGSNDVYDVVNDEGKSILVPALKKWSSPLMLRIENHCRAITGIKGNLL